ncbi:NADPH:quinone reductase [Roseicyclus mahoneyensis]|uniref:NADPH:quinone reductase-like Zn-dependent oxidoreductase n=1 Tax=Roseicyclus mahoneyensis TaxID=164332 RepID=A0A316GK91_9RHOB|nr:NADPH:quinone reductase [Roseicyclus mahoneyensis]PWK61056.1 NADPH:quinone reductase-like Zn-dependent oxidoreductase [Roseicyclus mahoneyensis]
MRAVWYERFGPAREVLSLGEMPDPVAGPGEVLVRLHASGVNPSDVKLRAGARAGAVMAFPRIVPQSDGAGVIAAVGAGVDAARVGERVWVWNAGWHRAFGTAAEMVALPNEQAVRLPDGTSFADGACFGIPAMTAWYAVMGDGPVAGQTVLVTGGAGTVGRYAVQMARAAGARVIATVSSEAKGVHSTAEEWVNYRETDVTGAVLEMTGGAGVDRIIEVDFGANQAVDLALIKPGGVIAAYASAAEMVPRLEFYPFMFKNARLHMLIVYQLAGEKRRAGERQLTDWLEAGALSLAVVPGGGLGDCAAAHDLVASGAKLGTVVLDI